MWSVIIPGLHGQRDPVVPAIPAESKTFIHPCQGTRVLKGSLLRHSCLFEALADSNPSQWHVQQNKSEWSLTNLQNTSYMPGPGLVPDL